MSPESVEYNFQPLPINAWEETRNTLHLYLQIVGKVRMYAFPRSNHWWHIPFRVSTRGLTTGPIPWKRRYFDMEFDLVDHSLNTRISDGFTDSMSLQNLSVAGLYRHVLFTLMENGIELDYREPHPFDTPFSDIPFEDNRHPAPYDPDYAHRFWVILRQVDIIFQKFLGRFNGKSTPPQLFWHHMDLAMARFSGKKAPEKEGAGIVEREAYSHELIAFGFWAGDQKVRAPAFYGYASPSPEGLYDEPLAPEEAAWKAEAGMALMMYDDIRESRKAESKILDFLESVYQAAAKRAGWDIGGFKLD
jgi:hypothetical protein